MITLERLQSYRGHLYDAARITEDVMCNLMLNEFRKTRARVALNSSQIPIYIALTVTTHDLSTYKRVTHTLELAARVWACINVFPEIPIIVRLNIP